MTKPGTITFKQKDGKSYFYYSFKIGSYHAAKILEYIAQIEHEAAPFRGSKGKFTSVNDLLATSSKPIHGHSDAPTPSSQARETNRE